MILLRKSKNALLSIEKEARSSSELRELSQIMKNRPPKLEREKPG
jgi:hypothetical protein